jgi:uncharacterized RDD family membrane protein YckC
MTIGVATLLGVFLLPAITFALVYSPIVTNLSRGLVSPYVKADLRKRFRAASIDGLMVVTLCLFCGTTGSLPYLAAAAAYVLLRDAIGGQSVGKLLLGLVAIDLQTGRAASVSGSVKRNLLLLLPGANVVAIILEWRTIATDPQGQRLGDRLAQTQVVEGAGARELVKTFQNLLMSLGKELDHVGRGRRRVPRPIDRAA